MSPQLTDLLKGLATEPDTLKSYLDDPEAAMTTAGVPDDEKEIMHKNEFTKLGVLPSIVIFIHNQGVSGS
jgi:hypothetical protein